MTKRISLTLLALIAAAAVFLWHIGGVDAINSRILAVSAVLPADLTEVKLPFTLANGHIFLRAAINGTPVNICLDTGNKFTLIDIGLAGQLHLPLNGNLAVKGNGAQTAHGAFVRGSTLTLEGFPGFAEPVTLAIPLRNLSPRVGRSLDGLLGSDFLSRFVVEIDYEKKTLTLHNKDSFHYTGPGESVPIHLTANGHPVLRAAVQPTASDAPISGDIVLDLGAGGSLELHTPFVRQHHLPSSGAHTFADIGTAGVGGEAHAALGRIAALRIGSQTLLRPTTAFSSDTAGAAADTHTIGKIGYVIASHFKLFLDYAHSRIIFEPARDFAAPFERAYAGVAFEASGDNFNSFRVADVAPGSPASAAGLLTGDTLTAVNGKPSAAITYDDLLAFLRTAAPVRLTLLRSGSTVNTTLTPVAIP